MYAFSQRRYETQECIVTGGWGVGGLKGEGGGGGRQERGKEERERSGVLKV